jgi:hypothetical protein
MTAELSGALFFNLQLQQQCAEPAAQLLETRIAESDGVS